MIIIYIYNLEIFNAVNLIYINIIKIFSILKELNINKMLIILVMFYQVR